MAVFVLYCNFESVKRILSCALNFFSKSIHYVTVRVRNLPLMSTNRGYAGGIAEVT